MLWAKIIWVSRLSREACEGFIRRILKRTDVPPNGITLNEIPTF